jgi:hypothetical protein
MRDMGSLRYSRGGLLVALLGLAHVLEAWPKSVISN